MNSTILLSHPMTNRLLLSFLSIYLVSILSAQDEPKYEVACVGFYNVENLFDTLDTENKRDKEYTPEGSNAWNTEKYEHKLGQIASVIHDMGTKIHPRGLAVLGIAEVENITALTDLANHPTLSDRYYQPILIEGPDRRGIDVGLLYDSTRFTPSNIQSVPLVMEDTSFHTRDQLVVSGLLEGMPVHMVVAHWPSRSGGQKRSETKRMAAGSLGREIVDGLLSTDAEAQIIYMGDLNDDPKDKSVMRSFRAIGDKAFATKGKFFNPMFDLYNRGVGSLAWRDTWNLFDQMLLSPSMVDEDESAGWSYHTTRVYNKTFLTQAEGNFKGYPFRTYAGGSYAGGYSDHFPVYVVLKRPVQR